MGDIGTPKKKGRPTLYSQELADEICNRIALGESLYEICETEGMPDRLTILKWKRNNEEFGNQYTRAKEDQADAYEEMMLREANTQTDVNRARLIVDTLKWTASKLKPKKYGDKVDLTTNGKDLPQPLLGGVSIKPETGDTNS